jgi:hypothetical protein
MPTKSSPKRKSKSAPQKAKAETGKRQKSARSLEEVVGPEVYRTWVGMLGMLVPGGRTHRLGPLLAAMLQYAYSVAEDKRDEDTDENSIVQSLLDSTEVFEASEVRALLHDAVTRLFEDAGVEYGRISARGDSYSIVDEAYEEYIHWFDMPWE